jgi:hypothetical protein
MDVLRGTVVESRWNPSAHIQAEQVFVGLVHVYISAALIGRVDRLVVLVLLSVGEWGLKQSLLSLFWGLQLSVDV